MITLYTYQIARWRQVGATGIPMLDTSIKTGDFRVAPTWPLLLSYKRGQCSEDQYRIAYRAILDYWWEEDPLFFEWLLSHDQLALGCYCRPGAFCHRHLLVQFLQSAVGANYHGELPQ